MAVYYKFKSAKDYDSILIEGQFISVLNLKERIFESKLLGSGTDFDLMVSNAQSNEEYVDEAAMIPKNTSVLIRRIPRGPQKTIITERDEPKVVEDKVEDLPPQSSTLIGDSSTMRYPEEFEWDEFGNDLYAIPEVIPSQPSKPVMDVLAANKVDEDSKIKALIDTPALDWNSQTQDNGAGRGFRRGGRMMGSRGFGRGGLDRKTPPAGYVCYRCNVPGHFIQHCPTNGDANYDIRRVKPPTGIPKSMLMATPDGSYALPSGAVAVLKPNEAAFEKAIEGLPTARPVSDLPPELHCPLCKEVMKDAVLTSKCCFRSFCDKCIRDYLITRSVCVCGNSNTLADDLLPNKTLRETISRILESKSSSTENAGSMVQVQDMESARLPSQKTLSPDLSAALNNEHKPQMIDHSLEMKEGDRTSETKARNAVMTLSDKDTINANVSQATPEAMSKEPMLVPPESTAAPGGIKEKQHIGEQGKKKKKKKTHLPCSADMHWRNYHDVGVENFAGMALAASMYQPYWSGGMPLGMDGYMAPLGGPVPCVGYTPSPFDVPFGGGIIPRDPFASQGLMMPVVQRDLSELGVHSMSMSMNQGLPVKSRGEFEATKVNLRCKREMEHHNDRRGEHSKERELRRESSGINDGSSVRSKPLPMSRSDRADRAPFVDRRGSPRNRIRQSPQRPGKRTAAFIRDGDADADAIRADRKQKVFPDASDAREGVSKKKRKPSSSEFPKEHLETSSHRAESRMGWSASHRSGGRYDHGSSEEEEYHLKRRPSASSRREAVESEEKEVRRSRGSMREREPRERRGRGHVYGHERPASERRSVVCEREREFMY